MRKLFAVLVVFVFAAVLVVMFAIRRAYEAGSPASGGGISVQSNKTPFAKSFEALITLEAPAAFAPEASASQDYAITAARPGANRLQTVLTIVPFKLQELELGPFAFTDENGKQIKTGTLKINITPARTGKGGLLDIHSPFSPFNWPLLAAFLAALAAGGYIAYKIRRRRAAPPAPAPGPYDMGLPAHQVALGQLGDLLSQDLWAQGQYKNFYTRLSDIYRDYLTARFGFAAHKYTSRDLSRRLRAGQMLGATLAPRSELFLKSADLVKFAKVVPTQSEKEADINNLKVIISYTAEAAQEEAPK